MEKSKSDILRKPINKAIDDGVDFSNSSARNQFWLEFCKFHPNFDKVKGRPLFVKIAKKCLEDHGVDLAKVGLTRKKTYRFNVELAAKMTSTKTTEPQSEYIDSEQSPVLIPEPQNVVISETIKYNHWTVKSSGALFQCMLTPLKSIQPEMKLSEEEVDLLGEMWLPTLQRYGSEIVQYIILPALATIGILVPKFYTGYKLKKEQSNVHN